MATYTLRLVRREEIARGTMAFSFEKPAGFHFKPGQFIEVTLLDPPETDAEGDIRAFSLASAPFEAELMVATRMRDTAFKRVLRSLPIGTEVTIDGPHGLFTLHDDATRPSIFLMGGIGITPVRSIILQAAHERLPRELCVLYSNRRPADAAFLEELEEAQRRNPHYRLVATMTQPERSHAPWKGETGHVNRAMLAKHIRDLAAPTYYVSGPPEMVRAMQAMLSEAGVSHGHIRTEEFPGY